MIATALMGNMLRIPLLASSGKSVPLIPLDLVVAGFVLLGVLEARRHGRWMLDAATTAGIGFLGVAALSLISAGPRLGLSIPELLFGGAYLARWGMYFGVFAVASAWISHTEAIQLALLLKWAVIVFALFGIVQVLLLPGFAQIVYPDAVLYADWDPQGRRLVSTFLDPNFAGMFLVLGLCLWGGAYLAGAAAPRWQGFVLGAALLLTLSRGSALSALFAATTMLLVRGPTLRAARALLVAMLATVAAVPVLLPFAAEYAKLTIDASALQRLLAWQKAVTLVSEYPWLGVGFNTVGFVLPRYGWNSVGASSFGLDGGLLFIAALTGSIGVTAFLIFLWRIMMSARQCIRDDAMTPEAHGIAIATMASVVAITVHATFTNTLLLSLLLAPCWLLWALPRALRRGTAHLDAVQPPAP